MSIEFFSTSNRIKETPFTSRNNDAGVKKIAFITILLIPTVFKSLKSIINTLLSMYSYGMYVAKK